MTRPICVLCKGARNLCGKPSCELLSGIYKKLPVPKLKSRDIEGSSPPAVFVGRYGYPNVNIGPVAPPVRMDDASELNDPTRWYGQDVEDIVSKRFSLVRGRSMIKVRTRSRLKPLSNPQRVITEIDSTRAELQVKPQVRRILESSQELAMSAKTVDIDMKLNKVPSSPRASLSTFTAPYGPNADIRQARLIDNPAVPRKVDAVVSDTDALANTGMKELFDAGIPERQIQSLLSIGLLGQKKNRRLVPTRWSITATDDSLGKAMISEIMGHNKINDIEVYSDKYIGNNFHVILIPYAWHFDMIETWLKGAFWAADAANIADWEGPKGRKRYASNVTGAYYTARLEVLKHLRDRRRQAACMIYREVTDEYWAPLGVWVIGETVKAALKKKPLIFEDLDYAVKFINRRIINKTWPGASRLLKMVKTQRTLEDY